ncbi:MAG: hypothetical protein ABI620_03035 [Chloroflexota bacterium]
MTIQGRSFDDLPLAAYSTGVDPATEPPEMAASVVAPAHATAVVQLNHLDAAAQLPIPEDEGNPAAAALTPAARARGFASANPRLIAGIGFVAVIVVGATMLLGGGTGPNAAAATVGPSAPGILPVAADPGAATLVLTGSVQATYSMTGNAGQPVTGNLVGATWADSLQNVLTLSGPLDRGTRTTDAGLVLTWGLMVEDKLVTFTSKHGECTIGMASNPKSVTGSFACRKLKSDDGKLTVGASGTYRT